MSYECFDVETQDHVTHITLNRPEKRNSMIPAFWNELPELINQIDREGSTRAIVISSTGPHFTSGMDVAAFAPSSGGGAEKPEGTPSSDKAHLQRGAKFYDTVLHLQKTFSCLEQARMPVLAAIQGGCIGGGVDLVTACDMRYATADAFFTIYETNIGMTADVGTFPRICKLIPDGVVRELAYTGRRMSAQEAKDVGLVNRVFEDQQQMVDGVLEIAAEIASKAPLTVYGCKRMILHARDHAVADTLDYIGVWNASFFQREEVGEAMMALREKRAGNFAELPERVVRREAPSLD